MTAAIPLSFDHDHARVFVGNRTSGRAHIFHCNYYNTYLLRTIWKDVGAIFDTEPLLIGAAVEQAYFPLRALFETLGIVDPDSRKAFATRFYSWQGFGTVDLTPIDASGGTTMSDSQHYAEGWKAQFGRSDAPVGFVTRGWLAGAAAAIHDLPPDHYSTHQHECAAVTGGHRNVFELRADGANFTMFDGNGVDALSPRHDVLPEIANDVDAAAIGAALRTLPLFGKATVDGGLIRHFDVTFTWHPHQYYDRISFECLRRAIVQFGATGRELIEPLLEEAGHRCGFRTFGGIWRSTEWAALVEPMCTTVEDWVAGLIAILNCAGWGRIQCTKLTPGEAVFVVHDDYESVGYESLYGRADFAATYLLPGGFRGMMNLIFNGDIRAKPALTERFYDSLSRRDDAYETHIDQCRAMGDPVSVYRVTRKAASRA